MMRFINSLSVICIAVLCFGLSAQAQQSTQITPEVTLVQGSLNSVSIERNNKRLVIYGDMREQPELADTVLFTHHRRDVAWAGQALVEDGAKAIIPQQERQLFEKTEQFWNAFTDKRFHDYEQQTSKVLATSIQADKTVLNENFTWEGLDIQAISTPGYTRGAVSYLFTSEGKRIACTGDLILAGGKLLDLYSLQDKIDETNPKTRGYHGFASRSAQLIQSLNKMAEAKPDILIPVRGPIIEDPQKEISLLITRIQNLYRNFLSTTPLRWYWKDDFIHQLAARVLDSTSIDWMPIAETRNKPPRWIIPIQNARLIVSDTGCAFMIDCGNQTILNQVKTLLKEGTIQSVDGLYITHYHDDHTDMAQAFADEFKCQVYFTPKLQDILEHPSHYRLPAMTSIPITSSKPVADGSSFQWQEYNFTFDYHPGQTIYHGSLLIERNDDETVFFCGDSFAPTGMDDYCLLNRNLLAPDQGYFKCLNQLRDLPKNCWIINQHVVEPFRFTESQIAYMEKALKQRMDILSNLFPWDGLNYGIDEQWARFDPYGIKLKPGERTQFNLTIMNHSPQTNLYQIRIHPPKGWFGPEKALTLSVKPGEEAQLPIPISAPPKAKPGVYIITADILFNGWQLFRWAESLIEIGD